MRSNHCITAILFASAFLLTGCSQPEPRTAQHREKSPSPHHEQKAAPAPKATEPPPSANADGAQPTLPETPSTANKPETDKPVDQAGDAKTAEEAAAKAARAPKRPVDDWVIFRNAFKPKEDAACETQWLETNHFSIKTQNIQRMTIDMTQLPAGAPTRGPWVFYIDGQGVELKGFRPREGYTGLKRDLVRSQNGQWTVDRDRLYRAGE